MNEDAKKYFHYGLEAFEEQEFLKAEIYFYKSLELEKNRISIINNLIATYLELEKYNNAKELINNYKNYFNNNSLFNLNIGNYYLKTKDINMAKEYYINAIGLDEKLNMAYDNLALALKEDGKIIEGIDILKKSIEINPDYINSYYNIVVMLIDINNYEDALKYCELGVNKNINYLDIFPMFINLKMQVSDWKNIESYISTLNNKIKNKEIITNPFYLYSLNDDADMHQSAAVEYSNSFNKNNVKKNVKNKTKNKERNRIKIAYFSSDFHNHATSYLICELIELHDRNKFEIYGISFGDKYNDEMSLRISSAFEYFMYIKEKSNDETKKLIESLNIDIAIDLKGYTKNNRYNIFAERCAPLQISYLGFPGTMGDKNIDYIIADNYIINECNRRFFSEYIIYLPLCYQPNDSRRIISNYEFSKKEFGISDNSFVFCCFNNAYKITQEIFKCWIEILEKVPNSIIWLIDDNEIFKKNIKNYLINNNINTNRVIFSKRIKLDLHLARHKIADVFLDTFPYNAHTTASDSLFAGVPIITMSGNSFASRVCGSILANLELYELITKNKKDYVDLAVKIALDKKYYYEIKNKLKNKKISTNFFNSSSITKKIENAYLILYEKYIEMNQFSDYEDIKL